MTQEATSGSAVAERVRAADIAVGGNSPVTAMLANALRERKPLADDGAIHDTVQDAVNAASSFVFVPPGTFNESVTIDTPGLTLLGSGNATTIRRSSANIVITIDATNVTVESLKTFNPQDATGGGGPEVIAVNSGASNVTLKDIRIPEADGQGIFCGATDGTVVGVVVERSSRIGIRMNAVRAKVISCRSEKGSDSSYSFGANYQLSDDSIIANSYSIDSFDTGIDLRGNNCIAIGNRSISDDDDGIRVLADDCIVANNRISDQGANAIEDGGAGTTLDGNLTGASN